jgi:hypothetical protein
MRGVRLAGELAGELAQAQKSLHAKQEAGAPDAADENGDLHSDRPYAPACRRPHAVTVT